MCTLDDDPGLWPDDGITSNMRASLVEKGPIPTNSNGRRFTDFYYLPNNETVNRSWLVYSRSKDCVFCFCCKLFLQSVTTISFVSQGYCDWQHVSACLRTHEANHMECKLKWVDLQRSLTTCTGIDTRTEKIIRDEKQ